MLCSVPAKEEGIAPRSFPLNLQAKSCLSQPGAYRNSAMARFTASRFWHAAPLLVKHAGCQRFWVSHACVTRFNRRSALRMRMSGRGSPLTFCPGVPLSESSGVDESIGQWLVAGGGQYWRFTSSLSPIRAPSFPVSVNNPLRLPLSHGTTPTRHPPPSPKRLLCFLICVNRLPTLVFSHPSATDCLDSSLARPGPAIFLPLLVEAIQFCAALCQPASA